MPSSWASIARDAAATPAPMRSAWATPAPGAFPTPPLPPQVSRGWDTQENVSGAYADAEQAWVSPAPIPARKSAPKPAAVAAAPAPTRTATANSKPGKPAGALYFSASSRDFAEFLPGYQHRFHSAIPFKTLACGKDRGGLTLQSVQQGLWLFEASHACGPGWEPSIRDLVGTEAQRAKVAQMEDEEEGLRATYLAAMGEESGRAVLETLVVSAFVADAGWSGAKKLLETGDRPIYFLAPADDERMVFGVGTPEKKAHKQLAAKARGRNLLGEALMKARDVLRAPAMVAFREKWAAASSAERQFMAAPRVHVGGVVEEVKKEAEVWGWS